MIDRLSRCFRQVVAAQSIIWLLASLIALIFFGALMARSTAFGGAIAIINTWLAWRSVKKSSELAYQQNDLGMLPLLSGWVQRLILFAASLTIGVVQFGLLPLGMVTGFVLTQIGYLACRDKPASDI